MNCIKCGRKLTHPESVLHGMGPECWKAVVGRMQKHSISDQYSLAFSENTRDIRCRFVDGTHFFNFAQVTGSNVPMRWGTSGNAGDEFSINSLMRMTGDIMIATEPLIYREFTYEFISKIPRAGGVIKYDDVMEWLERTFPLQYQMVLNRKNNS